MKNKSNETEVRVKNRHVQVEQYLRNATENNSNFANGCAE